MNKNELIHLFKNFNNLNVLIIGDVMVDAYYFGEVDRISPEAPVPIVAVKNKETRLGGAANVALNVQALGANAILCAVIGNDIDGSLLTDLIQKNNLTNIGIISNDNRTTTVKTRIIGNKNQVLRVDSENDANLSKAESDNFFNTIENIISNKKIDVVIFEDYDKGVITENLIKQVINLCNNKNIPTTVDPKKRNFNYYKNVSLFKPNLKELKEGLNLAISSSNLTTIQQAINLLNKTLDNKITFITLSENGVYISDKSNQIHIAAHLRTISDVSGAGDTVISVASLCLALNQSLNIIAEISNLAGGLVCEKVGVAPINKDLLLNEAITKLI